MKNGFRRSGALTYRPCCDHCQACVPVRILTDKYKPNRTQRRTAKHHASLEAGIFSLVYRQEHYELYLKYQSVRHHGSGMDQDSREQYRHFLLQSNVQSNLVEFREDGKLRMVSIIDRLRNGISSVYTFFEPNLPNTSYGTYSVIWQTDLCKKLKLPYLYLGYWIEQSKKMAYKANFRPAQGFVSGRWQTLWQ